MFLINWMDNTSLWGIFLLILLTMFLSVELGFAIGNRERLHTPENERVHSSTAIGASMGLLAFILAFTFSFTSSRLDIRKHLVLEEANAVGTAYLRAGALASPYKENAKRLLTLYTDDRALTVEQINQATVLATAERSHQLHAQLWQLALSAAEQTPTPITALFMSAINEVIDLHQERITIAKQQRMPWIFWVALVYLTILTMLLAGHDAGHAGARRSVSNLVVAVAFSIVFTLVIALDRPLHRFNLVNQEPFFDLKATMDELKGTP